MKARLTLTIVVVVALMGLGSSVASAAPAQIPNNQVVASAPQAQAVEPIEFSPQAISLVLAGLLSILATLIPGFRVWFAGLREEVKQSAMAIVTALVAIAIYILACTPSLGFPYVACPTGGFWGLVSTIVLAWTSNQGVDRIFPKPADVKAAKAAAKAKRDAQAQ